MKSGTNHASRTSTSWHASSWGSFLSSRPILALAFLLGGSLSCHPSHLSVFSSLAEDWTVSVLCVQTTSLCSFQAVHLHFSFWMFPVQDLPVPMCWFSVSWKRLLLWFEELFLKFTSFPGHFYFPEQFPVGSSQYCPRTSWSLLSWCPQLVLFIFWAFVGILTPLFHGDWSQDYPWPPHMQPFLPCLWQRSAKNLPWSAHWLSVLRNCHQCTPRSHTHTRLYPTQQIAEAYTQQTVDLSYSNLCFWKLKIFIFDNVK